jgi:uncharacterized protein (DUF1800 family)
MTASSDKQATAVALNRFGLGVRPDESQPVDPKAWLLAQFERYTALPAAWADEPTGASQVVAYGEYLRALRQADAGSEQMVRRDAQMQTQTRYRAAVNARVTSALDSPAPFAERLVHFWANHFAVSIEKPPLAALAGAFEAEAIRPHVFGRFEDMLLAVERHPAMLLYLDQARSMGPGSAAVMRLAVADPQRQRGLNENLAREILELHTLGVRSGYSQNDVAELARALTGWTIGGLPGLPFPARMDAVAPGHFGFQPLLHEPGVRLVLGRRYEQRGQAQALAILHDLANAPATAQHVATKMARHFAGDTPPPPLVERLADVFMRSSGDLPSIYKALIESPEVWTAAQAKFKTPWEWSLSSLRGLGVRNLSQPIAPMLTQLGQPVWRPGSPAGYDDIAESWAAPDALMRRVEVAQRLAARAGSTLDARVLGPQLLPAGLSEATAREIGRAESPAIALALLLASPEFLRR